MNIAVFGNTNNYPLLLAEGLISLGHKVRLFVNRKGILHRPESKYPEWAGNYPSWIHDCSHLTDEDVAYETASLRKVVSSLRRRTDFAILNDVGPAMSGKLGCPHAALLSGSDLTYYANFELLDLRSLRWEPAFKRSARGRRDLRQFADLVCRQRSGILGAAVVSFPLRGLVPEGDRLLDMIGVSDQQRMLVYLSDVLHLEQRDPPANERLRIFNGCRVVWRQSDDRRFSSQDLKATDILLAGYARYCTRNGAGELHMPGKGEDVPAAHAMARELGIADRIVWHNEMALESFRNQVVLADIVCDQLGASLPGLVTTDAYAMGRPVLANLRNEIFEPYLGAPLPGLQAATPEDVCDALLWADKNRDGLRRLGMKSRQFAEQHLSPVRMAGRLLAAAGCP